MSIPHSPFISAETDPQLSKIELADLEFMDNVGAGSFGKVWKGRWKSKNKIVAIKKVMELEKQLKREASPCSCACTVVLFWIRWNSSSCNLLG